MLQGSKLDFTGHSIFCGVDVHKKNWRVNIQNKEFELEDFSQDADVEVLYKHLKRRYPGADLKICYEAGFSGFSAQRYLSEKGINCLVVNPADVSTTDKEKRQKNDKIDARKLCNHLQGKHVKYIYIPEVHWEHGRSLVRAREKIVRDQSRCKNRIWQLLYFSGLPIPRGYEAGQYWSRNFVKELENIECGTAALKLALQLYIKEYQQIRLLQLEATRSIRKQCRQPEYSKQINLLRTIKGIGEINAAVILFELQNIKRFKEFDQLCSYAGLVPDTGDSGELKVSKGLTNRKNQFLRVALIESSWQVVRKDPALLMMYNKYCKRMHRNQAIIRIAKHLLARINYVLKNEKEYVTGIVG